MQYDSPLRKVWRILSPMAVYFGVTMVVSIVASFILSYHMIMTMADTAAEEFAQALVTQSLEMSVPVTVISGLLSLPFLWRMIRKDMKGRFYVLDKSTLKPFQLVFCAVAGITGCVAGSILVTISQIGTVFTGYDSASEMLFTGNTMWQLLALGLVAPFVEETIFRGLIYNRLKDYSSVTTAMLTSAVIFGLYHGNLIQAVYGFSMGLLMAFVYEKFHTIIAPLICHGAANIISVVLQFLNVKIASIYVAGVIALLCLAVLYLSLRYINRNVHTSLKARVFKAHTDSASAEDDVRNDGCWDKRTHMDSSTPEPPKFNVDDYYPKNDRDDQE